MKRNIVSRKQAAILLSVSIKTIDRWVRGNRIQAFKPFLSNRVLIYEDSLTEGNLQSIKPNFKNTL